MPQNEKYWNPFRLIPVKEKVERSTPWTDERFRGHSGRITCTIENLTPLFIGAQSSGTYHPSQLRENKRVIPGSSLKGMLRSLAEIVGGGCFVVSNDKDTEKIPKSPVPFGMERCRQINQLCIACRMFGAMESGHNARVHKGKVSIGDALIRETNMRIKPMQVLLSNNGVRHEPFYRSPVTRKLDGRARKLYFHQPERNETLRPIPENIQKHSWKIDALLPGHHFDFEVQFTSLTAPELSLLLYILCLEENVSVAIEEGKEKKLEHKGPMRHKIGNAKPFGLGSCHIHVTKLTYLSPPAQRFATMASPCDRDLDGDSLRREIEQKIMPHVQDQSPTLQMLRKMMVWDETDKRDFHYPEYYWFKNTANIGVPLKNL
ncbi:MAG: RAMP superfamily CRISPR-associated protein [Thermodesulfobacteriota bacterium]